MVARDLTIPGEPDEVWDTLTDPELPAEWFGGEGNAVVEADWAQRLVVWMWDDDEPGSRVELQLVAVPEGTRVILTEAPVGPFALAVG